MANIGERDRATATKSMLFIDLVIRLWQPDLNFHLECDLISVTISIRLLTNVNIKEKETTTTPPTTMLATQKHSTI